jgi:hypothetical protein
MSWNLTYVSFMYRIMGGEVLDDLNRGVYRLRDFEVL